MTVPGFAFRLMLLKEQHPTQVIVGFLHPDGLEVFVPVSAELMDGPPEVIGPELMRLHHTYAAEARGKPGRATRHL